MRGSVFPFLMAADSKSGLTPKQQRFVDEYIVDWNGTQAAIRAGYSKKTARSIAAENLTKPDVARAIQEALDQKTAECDVTVEYILEGLKEVNERCRQARPVMVFDPVLKKMVQAVDENGNHIWQFDSMGANRALELLGKYKGMFVDRVKQEDGALSELRSILQHDRAPA